MGRCLNRWCRRGVLLQLAASLCAQVDRPPLVSTAWLEARLRLPDLVLLHVGAQKDYDTGHIPGARLLTLADISVTGPGELRLELPPKPVLDAAFSRLGVTASSIVIVYAGNDVMQSATRAWFTLDYLGVRASLLDGPLRLWREEGRHVSTDRHMASPGEFAAKAEPRRIIDAAALKSQLDAKAVSLIDARTPEFYSGASLGIASRPGHIPDARNVPYTSLLDAQGRLKPQPALREALAADAARPLVVYCHIGQQATLVYFAARYLGLEVRLYDGSFQDWSVRPELPVER